MTAKRKVRRQLTEMQGLLKERALEDAEAAAMRQDMRRHVKSFAFSKYLFVYGKDGMGRFLDGSGKDMVKLRDQAAKVNPKYTFLHARLRAMFRQTSLY